jgi:2-polyprenyl-3-methyl-5-hydroxy-6-metoxy-1,4-benzoquinol methylase
MQIRDPESHARYIEKLERHLRRYYGEVLGLDVERVTRQIAVRIARTRGEAYAAMIDEVVGLQGKRLLDVGCGWGELVLSSLELGASAEGIEPNSDEVAISRLLLASFGFEPRIYEGFGEELPFADAEFDVVTCQHVLEHVRDIGRVVNEMVRVTRPGGHMVVSVPNYLFPYEGHYGMKWIPLIPKRLGAVILRSRGKDPTFLLESVNYTTYPQMMRLWRRHRLRIRNITRERLEMRSHASQIYRRRLVRPLALHLNLFPTVTWLLQRPPSREP